MLVAPLRNRTTSILSPRNSRVPSHGVKPSGVTPQQPVSLTKPHILIVAAQKPEPARIKCSLAFVVRAVQPLRDMVAQGLRIGAEPRSGRVNPVGRAHAFPFPWLSMKDCTRWIVLYRQSRPRRNRSTNAGSERHWMPNCVSVMECAAQKLSMSLIRWSMRVIMPIHLFLSTRNFCLTAPHVIGIMQTTTEK